MNNAVGEETFAALSTPWGQSGIGVVRLSGFHCRQILREALHLENPQPNLARFATYCDRQGIACDGVMAVYFAAPKSYTGQDMLEISAHGNPLLLQSILEDLCQRGCRIANPGEFTRTAFLNGKMDLAQAESVMDLIHGQNMAAIQMAQRQLHGELGLKLAEETDALLDILATVEAQIDFADEELPPLAAKSLQNPLKKIEERLERLRQTAQYRPLLERGIQAVIVGPPNAGKSSLLNQILGHQRALVSPTAGTTRDFIEESILLGKWQLRIVDTAGLHAAGDAIEQLGIQFSRQKLAQADLLLWVFDQSQPWPNLEPQDWEMFQQKPGIVLLNKRDLPRHCEPPELPTQLKFMAISAHSPEDIDTLKMLIIKQLEDSFQPPNESALIVTLRQSECLKRAIGGLKTARQLLEIDYSSEYIAAELRIAMESLNEITGRNLTEPMLDRLFNRFCIGK